MLEDANYQCVYCEESNIRLTLDRIDNDKGHSVNNVNVACLRCNTLRQDLPIKVWLKLVPAIKESVEEGLFGDWKSLPPSRTSSDIEHLKRLSEEQDILKQELKELISKNKTATKKYIIKVDIDWLKKEVWLRPIYAIANDLNTDASSLRRYCDNNNITRPKQGHWLKK